MAPGNTIVLYSFSKFWGATGLRLSVIGMHESNALESLLDATGTRKRTVRAIVRARFEALLSCISGGRFAMPQALP